MRSATVLFGMLATSMPSGWAAAETVAATPPMGWNSWNCYGTTVTEAEVKASADYMTRHLKQHGQQYLAINIQWSEPNAQAHGYRPGAQFSMDGYGGLFRR
jgi:alpha-galactosidase